MVTQTKNQYKHWTRSGENELWFSRQRNFILRARTVPILFLQFSGRWWGKLCNFPCQVSILPDISFLWMIVYPLFEPQYGYNLETKRQCLFQAPAESWNTGEGDGELLREWQYLHHLKGHSSAQPETTMYITVQSQSSLSCDVSAICTGKVPSCVSLPRGWLQSLVPSIVIGEATKSLRETLSSTHGNQIVRVIIKSDSANYSFSIKILVGSPAHGCVTKMKSDVSGTVACGYW